MNYLSLFSGIGGMDLGLDRAGMTCVGQVEIDPFCRRVLAKHWPDVPKFDDVRTFTKDSLNATIDLIAGGFPCQDISYAGKGAGIDGERSGLWSEYLRIICEVRPRFVVVENSAALLVRGFGRLLGGLAACGFDAEWEVLGAADVGAPHERERVFIVAYADAVDGEAWMGNIKDGQGSILGGRHPERFPIWLQAASRFAGMDDGLPASIYRSRVESLGNAVVPQIAEWIGRRIMALPAPRDLTAATAAEMTVIDARN